MNENKIAEVNTLVRKNSKNELARLCKERNLSISGTKHDMAVRLIGGLQEKKEELGRNIRKIIIRKNQYGQWEFDRLVFDNKTKNVVGCLGDGGAVSPLQRQDIERCKKYKFRYVLPDILDERPDAVKGVVQDDSSDEEEDAGELLEEEG